MSGKIHVEALNLRHLRAWATVVEEGSVTAAARKLNVSQPALSQQLKALEHFFGTKLLERLPRGVKPTATGRALLSETEATLATSERLIRQAKSAVGLESGILEIAALPTLVDTVMFDPIRIWQTKYPRISIRIREFPLQSALLEAVSNGLGDIAIGVRPTGWQGEIFSLGWDQFMVLLSPDDPLLSDGGAVCLMDLKDRNWILYGHSNGLSDYVAAACSTAGFRPKEAVRTSQVAVAAKMALAGLGVALVPSLNIPDNMRQYARPLVQPLVWELTAFVRSKFTEPTQAFVDLLGAQESAPKPENAFVLASN